MSHANLADQKAVYFHPSGTINLPAWLGKFARVKDTLDDGFGKLDVEYLTFDRPGESLIASRAYDSPGPSTLSLLAKESVVSNLYTWSVDWDIDVRKQCTDKSVDHPLNWAMIKRFCKCWPSQLRAEEETSINAGNGETVLTVPVTAACRPVIIKPVAVADVSALSTAAALHLPKIDNVHGLQDYAYYPDTVNAGLLVTDLDAVEHIVLLASDDGMYYSHDNGQTYVLVSGLPAMDLVCFGSYSKILASNSTDLYLSSDGGKTYAAIDVNGLIASNTIAIVAASVDSFYILTSNYTLYLYDDAAGLRYISTLSGIMSLVYDFVYADGVLYASGYTDVNTALVPTIAASDDNGENWAIVYQLLGLEQIIWDDLSTVFRLASVGNGVLYGALSAEDTTNFVMHSYVIRSVNWGANGTWEVLHHNSVDVLAANTLFLPMDVACYDVNHAKVIGIVWEFGGANPVFDDYQILTLEG